MIYKMVLICLLMYNVAGESCLDNNGVVGQCINLRNCSNAQAAFKRGEVPKYCRFERLELIVCCLQNKSNISTVAHKLETVTTKLTLINPYVEIPEEFPPGCTDVWEKNKYIEIINPALGVGGILSKTREFPYMAALGFEDENNKTVWGCGGTLISVQYVLTAAHCLYNINMGNVKYVRLGDLNLNSDEDDAQPQDFKVLETFRHPDNHPPAPYNDVGIIKLDNPCFINHYVIPACLNTKKEHPDRVYSATGWGQLGYGGALADHLQNMLIRIFNHTDCEKAYSKISKRRLPKGIDEDTQICAGAPNIDTCPGDSGGPLKIYQQDDNTVYGITSFGVACGISNIPGVYVKVSAFIPWIKSIILP